MTASVDQASTIVRERTREFAVQRVLCSKNNSTLSGRCRVVSVTIVGSGLIVTRFAAAVTANTSDLRCCVCAEHEMGSGQARDAPEIEGRLR